MHVAICDDNVADRKHLERLLSREADKKAGTSDNIFVESFGCKDQFLQNPLKYNIVFMDMCSQPGLVEEIFKALEPTGFCAPVVLYSSKIDYTKLPDLPDYVIHQTKPYIPAPLPELLNIGSSHASVIVPTITIHKKGIYSKLVKDDIAYAYTTGNQNFIQMENGELVEIDEDISVIRHLCEPYREFVRVNQNSMINLKYMKRLHHIMVTMYNQKRFFISPNNYIEIRYRFEQYLEEYYKED